VSRRRGDLWCPRRGHRLAWLEPDEVGRPVIKLAGVALGFGDDGTAEVGIEQWTAAQLEGRAVWNAYAMCPCGARYRINLVSVLQGVDQRLGKEHPWAGVSWRRPKR